MGKIYVLQRLNFDNEVEQSWAIEGFDKAVKSAELLSDSGGTYTIRFGSNSHIYDYEWSKEVTK